VEDATEPLVFERCKPADYLALCHVCYRYVGKRTDIQAVDYYDKCKDKKYKKFINWRHIAYRNK